MFVSAYEGLEYLRALDDFIAYRVSFKPHEDELKYKDSTASENWVSMMSPDEDEYRCLLPTIQPSSRKRIEAYSGPSPAELLQPIYDDGTCSYRMEAYWLYELCHGRYMLQYHEDKETKTRTEYYLGNYNKVQAEAEAKKFDQLNPPTKKFGEEKLPYFPVTYTQGTTCDLTNKPRTTTVFYVCDESSKNQVHSLSEVSSCNYEVVVMTNRLCAHPSFQKPLTKEHEIHCFPSNPEQMNPKPKSLVQLEKENTNSFFQEFSLLKGATIVKGTKDIFNKLMQAGESDDEFDQLNMILEALKTSTKTLTERDNQGSGDDSSSQTSKPTAPTTSDKMLMEQFWKGKACLSGGSGWWKHEICYGRSVVQFHEEVGKERVNIVLGVFHKNIHRKWAEEHPHKVVKKDNGKVYQVSNMYSQGDLCAETGAHRSCEVRLRCREQSPGLSPSKVLIYLLEPETCSYILVVESAMLCDGLQNVDEHGILPEMPELEEFETLHEPRKVSSKEHSTVVQVIKDENLESAVRKNKAIDEDGPANSDIDDEKLDREDAELGSETKPKKKSENLGSLEDLLSEPIIELIQKYSHFEEDGTEKTRKKKTKTYNSHEEEKYSDGYHEERTKYGGSHELSDSHEELPNDEEEDEEQRHSQKYKPEL
ncbi:glucosidase II beta subunit-like protein domain-containing protein [Ditylenchus destructor]|uniref:Endoplasmic reticulum lectin 1 n=1 Tax=Ditylenchus destructor TaxID=166010 RepID=A0AAD4NF76_9BILA|nr:glucosidase II beta subunit-like protein domain-containing protein [Ditylenchus destructor]